MTENGNFIQSKEDHRFKLATLFVVGFFVAIIIGLLGEMFGVFAGLEQLAAIFSSWITAVIGFYFLQQSNDQAWHQARDASKEATDARRTADRAGEKTVKFAVTGDLVVSDLRQVIKEQQETIQKQEKALSRVSQIIADYKELVDKMLGESQETSE